MCSLYEEHVNVKILKVTIHDKESGFTVAAIWY